MKEIEKNGKRGRWLAWQWAALASLGLAGTLFALDEIFEADTDGDGWTDAEEIIAGTDPLDSADPWDSDGDGIPDFLEFENGTDPLDPNDPPRDALATAAENGAATKAPAKKRSRGNAARLSAASAQPRVATTLSDDEGGDGEGDTPQIENYVWTVTSSYNNSGGYTASAPVLTKSVSGAYEIYTATLSLSGGTWAMEESQFEANYSFDMPAGNIVSVSLSADDDATVSAGSVSAHAVWTPENGSVSVSATSTFIQGRPEGMMTVSGTYKNNGGPYAMSLTVTVKRSLRKIEIVAQKNSVIELESVEAPSFSGDANSSLLEWRKSRREFGCGEKINAYVIAESPDVEASSTTLEFQTVSCDYGTCSRTGNEVEIHFINTEKNFCDIKFNFEDGEELTESVELFIPEYEHASEITEDKYLDMNSEYSAFDYGDNPYKDGHYFLVCVYPRNVTFDGIYHWENDYPEVKSGLFENNGINTVHTPSLPYQLNDRNCCTDKAYFSVSIPKADIEAAEGNPVGTLVWVCPVRWKMNSPGSALKNSLLPSDGSLPNRIQTMTLRKNLASVSDEDLLTLTVSKQFGEE